MRLSIWNGHWPAPKMLTLAAWNATECHGNSLSLGSSRPHVCGGLLFQGSCRLLDKWQVAAGWWLQRWILCSMIYRIILPIDSYFSEGLKSTNQVVTSGKIDGYTTSTFGYSCLGRDMSTLSGRQLSKMDKRVLSNGWAIECSTLDWYGLVPLCTYIYIYIFILQSLNLAIHPHGNIYPFHTKQQKKRRFLGELRLPLWRARRIWRISVPTGKTCHHRRLRENVWSNGSKQKYWCFYL